MNEEQLLASLKLLLDGLDQDTTVRVVNAYFAGKQDWNGELAHPGQLIRLANVYRIANAYRAIERALPAGALKNHVAASLARMNRYLEHASREHYLSPGDTI